MIYREFPEWCHTLETRNLKYRPNKYIEKLLKSDKKALINLKKNIQKYQKFKNHDPKESSKVTNFLKSIIFWKLQQIEQLSFIIPAVFSKWMGRKISFTFLWNIFFFIKYYNIKEKYLKFKFFSKEEIKEEKSWRS